MVMQETGSTGRFEINELPEQQDCSVQCEIMQVKEQANKFAQTRAPNMKNSRSQTPATALKPATEEVSTQTDLTPEMLTLRRTPGKLGKTSFTHGVHQFFANTDSATAGPKKPSVSFLAGGNRSFLGDRGRRRIQNLRNKDGGQPPVVDLHDENYDGAPNVVEADPLGLELDDYVDPVNLNAADTRATESGASNFN